MFFCCIRIKRIELFIKIAAAFSDFFKRLAALTKQFHQIRELRASAGINVSLLNMPLQIGRHVLRLHGVNVMVIQPQQFIGVKRTG
ncbi:hypothetical protein D3C72_1904570 [compost metagenome]